MAEQNFSGIWRLDLARSVLKIEAPRELLMKITHDGMRVRQQVLIVRAGGEDHGDFEFTVGAESVSAIRGQRAVVRAHWEDAVLIVESLVSAPGGELKLRDHWTLTNDGATLTMTHSDDELAGQISVLERGTKADAQRFA